MSLVQTLPGRDWPGLGADYPGRPPAQLGDALYLDNIQGARISSGGETHGQLSDTGYTIESGSWRVKSDGVEQWIECIVAGTITRRNLSPYGTIKVELSKNAGLLSRVQFLTFDPSTSGAGYHLGFLAGGEVELTRTTAVTLMRTAAAYYAAGARYTFAIPRADDGEFTVYIKGGTFTTPALLDPTGGAGTNPVTDNVHTTSLYWAFDADAGDRLYLDQHHAGVIAP